VYISALGLPLNLIGIDSVNKQKASAFFERLLRIRKIINGKFVAILNQIEQNRFETNFIRSQFLTEKIVKEA
jgi:hypothetical protein